MSFYFSFLFFAMTAFSSSKELHFFLFCLPFFQRKVFPELWEKRDQKNKNERFQFLKNSLFGGLGKLGESKISEDRNFSRR